MLAHQHSDKSNKFNGVLYNCCEHWLPLVSGLVRKLILPDFQCSFYFDETKSVNLTPQEWQALQALLSRLQRSYGGQLQRAMLFGSKARGDADGDSDIDVLLLVEQKTWQIKDDISGIVADINLEYDLQIDIRVIGTARWQHLQKIQAGLYRNITRDAIPLAV